MDAEREEKTTQYVEDATPSSTSVDEPPTKLNPQTILAFISLCGQFNAYVMTLLIPGSLLSYINEDLGPDARVTWVTVSWQLGASVVVSIGGRLSDIFGRRHFMLTGASLGMIGCIVGATGKSIEQMIASGVIFGLASGFQEMSYAGIQEILPNKHRMLGVGIFDASLLLAYFSPLIAYAFIAHQAISWRGAYWYMLSFHSVFAILLFLCYKPPDFHMKHRHDGKTKLQLLGELDYVGIVLFVAASSLFLVGINFGGRQFPWKSAAVIAPICIGVLCAVVLGIWEAKADLKYPLLPPKLFRQIRGFVMVIVVCFVGGMLYYSMTVLWPQQAAQFFIPADQTVMRGLYSTIFSFGSFLGAIIMIVFCARVGREKWQLVGFMIAQTALIGSMASVGINDKTQAICVVLFASAMVTPPQLVSFTMLSLTLEDQTDIGIAVGLAGTFRLLGGATATAIYTAILSSTFSREIVSRIREVGQRYSLSTARTEALLVAAGTNTPEAYAEVPGMSAAIEVAAQLAVKLSYVASFKLVYLTAIGFGGAAIIAAACTRTTDKRLKNAERAVVLKNETRES